MLQNHTGLANRSHSAESSNSPNRLSKNHSVMSSHNNLRYDDVQTTASRVGHKSSAVFGTAERRSFTEEQATKDISVGPAAYNQLQAMKKVIFGKVKGQHALHQKQDVESDVLRRLHFSNS